MNPKLPSELMDKIASGESINVEFKKSATDITKDVYETVCSFSNRLGGDIFLGIKDDGSIIGVQSDKIENMKKDFVNTVNNGNKINPPLYLIPEPYDVDGKTIIHIHVPESLSVIRCGGRIFDRNNDSDIDITDNQHLVYQLYARKQNTYYVNTVFPALKVSDLRRDLIDRARRMTRVRTEHHPWMDTYKYTALYSGGVPEFIEGDVFRMIIPLNEVATATVGAENSIASDGVSDGAGDGVTGGAGGGVSALTIKLDADKANTLISFCTEERTKAEMMEFCAIRSDYYFRENILKPLLQQGILRRTVPEKPNSPKQKYIKA